VAKPSHNAAELAEAIALGAADHLTGRVLHPGDDLSALTTACQSTPTIAGSASPRLTSPSNNQPQHYQTSTAAKTGRSRRAAACPQFPEEPVRR
jgi:hypothetical protein